MQFIKPGVVHGFLRGERVAAAQDGAQARTSGGIEETPNLLLLFSDPGGHRTHDLRIKSPLLCQLSYRVGGWKFNPANDFDKRDQGHLRAIPPRACAPERETQ